MDHDFLTVHHNFTPGELLLLFLALRSNKELPPELTSDIESKLLSLVPNETQKEINQILTEEGKHKTRRGRDYGEKLEMLQEAIQKERLIQFDYISADRDQGKRYDDKKTHKVVPYGIAWRRDRCYLIGDLVYKDFPPINYRLDRIQSLRLTKDEGSPPGEFDLEEYLAESWRMFGGQRERVKVKFHKSVRHVFENRLGNELEKSLEELDEDHYLFCGKIRGVEGLETDLLALGDRCEVLQPEGLREKIKERARAIFEQYE